MEEDTSPKAVQIGGKVYHVVSLYDDHVEGKNVTFVASTMPHPSKTLNRFKNNWECMEYNYEHLLDAYDHVERLRCILDEVCWHHTHLRAAVEEQRETIKHLEGRIKALEEADKTPKGSSQ